MFLNPYLEYCFECPPGCSACTFSTNDVVECSSCIAGYQTFQMAISDYYWYAAGSWQNNTGVSGGNGSQWYAPGWIYAGQN